MTLTEKRLVHLAELLSLYGDLPNETMLLHVRNHAGERDGFTLGDLRALVGEALA